MTMSLRATGVTRPPGDSFGNRENQNARRRLRAAAGFPFLQSHDIGF
jgi:hypothetical protein